MPHEISSANLAVLMTSRWIQPDQIVDELARNREFKSAYRSNVGVLQSFTLRKHTLTVMDCYEKHFAQRSGIDARSRGLFRLFLALHDIGKPLAIEAGDKRFQHRFTVGLLRQTRASYPITDREFEDWIALVDGDPLGAYLKHETTLDDAAAAVRRMADRSSLKRTDFLKQLLTYYQCDAAGYTRRAGLMGMLDGLFEWRTDQDEIVFDEQEGLLRFSERIRTDLAKLLPCAGWERGR